MFEYELDGEVLQFTQEDVDNRAKEKGLTTEEYLNQHPEVKSVGVEKTSDVATQGAPVTSANDMASSSEDTSLGSQMLNSLGLGFAKFAKGFSSLNEGIQLGLIELFTPGEMTASEKAVELVKIRARSMLPGGLPSSQAYEPIITKLEENLPKYETQSITEDIEKGNYSQAGERAVNAALQSAPSIVAAFTGVGGLISLGTSAAGNKFEEEFMNNPQQSTGKLLLNAGQTGVTEASFELVTRGLLKRAGILRQAGDIEGAEEVIKGGALTIIKNLGISLTGEAGSEAATELTVALIDAIPEEYGGLGKKIDSKQLFYRLGDAGIVGGLVGGSISTVGEVSGGRAARERAEAILTPDVINSKISEKINSINKLADDLPNSTEEGKSLINEKIEQETQGIINLKKESSQLLSNLEGEDLTAYAQNIEKINNAKNVVKNSTSESEANLAKEQYQNLTESNNIILKQAAGKVLDKNIKSITKISKDIYGDDVEIKELTSDEVKTFVQDNPELSEDSKKSIAEEAALAQGFFEATNRDGKQFIVINKDVAADTYAVNVAGHEFLHKVLSKTFENNPQTQTQVGGALINELAKIDLAQVTNSKFAKRLDEYSAAPENVQAEEILTLLSDSITTGDLQFNENIFTKVGDVIRRFLQDIGFKSVKFNTGRDVYNFVKDYNKSIEKGKLRGALKKVAVEGVTGELITDPAEQAANQVKFSKVYQEVEAMKADLVNPATKQGTAFIAADTLSNEVDRRLPRIEGVTQEERADIVRNFVLDNNRGLVGLLNNYNPDRNDSIMGYLNSSTPGGKLLDARLQEFYKDDPRFGQIFQTTTDEAVARRVERETIVEETVEQQPERRTRAKVLADELNIADKVASEVAEANIATDGLINFRSVPNAATKAVGELLGISPTKIKSKANLTKGEVASAQRWFNKNAQLVIDALPQGFDVEGQATGVPRTVLQALYTKKETRAKTKAGLKGQVKRTNIKNSEFLALVDIVDGKPTRNRNTSARIIALADLLGKTITNQELRKTDPSLARIRSGMSDVMFSKAEGATLREENKRWAQIVKDAKQTPIDIKNKKDLQSYKDFVRDVLAPNLPESFFTVGTFAGAGAIGIKRNFAFTSKEDLNNTLQDVTFAEPDADIENASKSVGKYGKSTAKTVAEKLKNEEYHKSSRQGVKKVWLKIQEIIQNDPTTIPYFAQLFSSTSQNMGHFSRVASTLEFTNTLNEKNVEEHTLPATDFNMFLFNRAVQGNLDLYIDGALENYAQGSLPKSYDEKLKGEVDGEKFNYVTVPPIEHHYEILLGLKSKWIRYFNPLVNKNEGGINPNYLINAKGQTIAEQFNLSVPRNLHANKQVVSLQQDLLFEVLNNEISQTQAKNKLDKYLNNIVGFVNTNLLAKSQLSSAISNARPAVQYSKTSRGMSTFDFDETLIIEGKNFIVAKKGDDVKKISSGNWPLQGPKLAADGYEFDFTDFVNVRGGVDGPLLQKMKNQIKKYGNKNVFILTARPAEAATAIHEWLKTKDIDIPFENITGLGNSSGDAKAQWFVDKYAEGYNDMYFVDDALPNVEAVKHVFDQLDVKGKSVQAKIKFSKSLSTDFNKMLESTKGVGAEKIFSRIGAQKRGKNIGRFTFFVPPSADDFVGLLRYFVGKGEQGNADIAFFKKALIDPFSRADEEMKRMRQTITDDYKALRKKFPKIKKKLGKMIGVTGFTFDNAIRVYLWDKAGFDIPGLSKRDIKLMVDTVNEDANLKAFADTVGLISKQSEGYVQPGEYWNVESIASDLMNVVNKVSRKQFLAEWIENKNEIFSENNLNKIEATYGSRFREALENILWRMENGTNRPKGMGRLERQWTNWVNNSVGAIMFFNMRSAVLQTISSVNFINFEDNNIFAASKAFANQKQYWKDFNFLFNSDFLKQRRAGLQLNVNEAELASAVAGATNKAKAAIAYLLKIGFTPTQIADSFAIAAGGSTFYRNRINKYIKEGMNKADAEKQAMLDFTEIAEETQQSARPDRISQQQASGLGRLILAFANTPMQYNRLIKKAAGDLINRRGDWRSNVSRIIYYGAIQSFIFSALQQALFGLAFDDEEDDEQLSQKAGRTLNSMLDSLLRGSGLAGAVVSAIKNGILELREQNEKGFRADYGDVLVELLNVSPPIGSKARKVYKGGFQTYKFNKEVMGEMNTFDLDNPVWDIIGNVVSAATNLPLDRGFRKIDNISAALNQDNETWQRIAVALGWDQWSLGIETKYEKRDKLKEEIREKKKEEKKKAQQRCTKIKSDGERCKIMVNKPKTRCHYHD